MTKIKKYLDFLNEYVNEWGDEVANEPVRKPMVEPEPAAPAAAPVAAPAAAPAAPAEPAKDPEEIVRFHISDKFMKLINSLKGSYKVAELYYMISQGVQRKNLSRDPVDYLDIDDEGNVSFLKSRYFTEPDVWTTGRRQKMKSTKVLKEVLSEPFINTYIKETDVAAFINKLAALKSNVLQLFEWRGKELLRAYNYTKECRKDFGYTCANFFQKENDWGRHAEPTVDQYDIYVENPENCGVMAVMEGDKVVARRSFQQGPNVIDGNKWKKGETATVWGNYYGVGGDGSRYDTMIKDYLKEKYDAVNKDSINEFVVSLETRFTYYCPFDSMYVSFEKNLLANNSGRYNIPGANWNNTYHASCPKKYVDERIKEEEEKAKAKEVPPQPVEPEPVQEVEPEPVQEPVVPPAEQIKQEGPTYYRDKYGRFRRKTS